MWATHVRACVCGARVLCARLTAGCSVATQCRCQAGCWRALHRGARHATCVSLAQSRDQRHACPTNMPPCPPVATTTRAHTPMTRSRTPGCAGTASWPRTLRCAGWTARRAPGTPCPRQTAGTAPWHCSVCCGCVYMCRCRDARAGAPAALGVRRVSVRERHAQRTAATNRCRQPLRLPYLGYELLALPAAVVAHRHLEALQPVLQHAGRAAVAAAVLGVVHYVLIVPVAACCRHSSHGLPPMHSCCCSAEPAAPRRSGRSALPHARSAPRHAANVCCDVFLWRC
jgi:hypothetical protein